MSSPIDLEQLRIKKREIEQYLPEIEQKKDICNQLTENINYEKQKLQAIKREINFRSNRLSELHAQYRAITEKGAIGSKKQIEDIKTQIIKEKLEELLSQKIPEANIHSNKFNKNSLKENEFQNLIHSNIKIIYTKYDSPVSKVKKEEIQFFRISSHTKFSTLKEAACHYWRIETPNDFVFTDDAEAIIYNEEYLINNYMKYYSVRSNMIKLICNSLLRIRPKLIPVQEDRVKEENCFKVKSRFEVKQRESGSNTQKVNEFIYSYSGLTPYYLAKDEQRDLERDLDKKNADAKDIETSFIMLILNLLFFILTIVFIYYPSKDIWLNNHKKKFITDLLLNFTKPTVLDRVKTLSSVHAILSIVKKRNCITDKVQNLITGKDCFYEEYSKSTKNDTTMNLDFNGNFFTDYSSSNKAQIHISVYSDSGYFHGNGYQQDYDTNNTSK